MPPDLNATTQYFATTDDQLIRAMSAGTPRTLRSLCEGGQFRIQSESLDDCGVVGTVISGKSSDCGLLVGG